MPFPEILALHTYLPTPLSKNSCGIKLLPFVCHKNHKLHSNKPHVYPKSLVIRCSVKSEDASTLYYLQNSSMLSPNESAENIRRSNSNENAGSSDNVKPKRIPWNKGKKHSPETVRLIKERTKQALQDPKIRKKIASASHPQTEETKLRIAMSVKKTCKERREKKMLQETCIFFWKESIAEAARIGVDDDEVLQWDSYEIEQKKIREEWIQSIKVKKAEAKKTRAPKSLEERKKLSETIKLKWKDPAYRDRVASGVKIALVRAGVSTVTKKRPRRKNSDISMPRRKNSDISMPRRKNSDISTPKVKNKIPSKKQKSITTNVEPRPKEVPRIKFEDPLSISKLAQIKKLRTQQSKIEAKKSVTTERARLLIAEAEKAAEALEAVAETDSNIQTLFLEIQKLLAEAKQTLQSLDSSSNSSSNILEGKKGSPSNSTISQALSYPKKPAVHRGSKDPIQTNSKSPLSLTSTNGHINGNYHFANGNTLNGTWTSDILDKMQNISNVEGIDNVDLHEYINSLFKTNNVVEETENLFELAIDSKGGNTDLLLTDTDDMVSENTSFSSEYEESTESKHVPFGNLSVAGKNVTIHSSSSEDLSPAFKDSHTVNGAMSPKKAKKKIWVRGRLVEVVDN